MSKLGLDSRSKGYILNHQITLPSINNSQILNTYLKSKKSGHVKVSNAFKLTLNSLGDKQMHLEKVLHSHYCDLISTIYNLIIHGTMLMSVGKNSIKAIATDCKGCEKSSDKAKKFNL